MPTAAKKRVKIVSDGTSAGTVITYDGNPFGMVTKLRIDVDVKDKLARCKMEIVIPEFEMEFEDEGVELGTKSFKKCPECGKWICPEAICLKGTKDPAFTYKCLDCNWSEATLVPLEWGQEEKKDG